MIKKMSLLGGSEPLIAGLVSITGSLFLSLLLIVVLLIVLTLMFRIPLEFTAVLLLPFLLVVGSYEGALLPVLGVVLIYLGIIMGKHFFFSK